MKQIRNIGFLILIAGVIVGLDQWAKAWVRATLTLGEWWNPIAWMRPYLHLTFWTNTGMAFGQLQNAGPILTVVAIIVSGIILWYYWQLPAGQWWVRAALAMQLGGAIGNLVDRLRFGTVTDWIEVTHFPVFNLADASISVGVAVLALLLWRESRAEAAKPAPPSPVSPSENATSESSAQ